MGSTRIGKKHGFNSTNALYLFTRYPKYLPQTQQQQPIQLFMTYLQNPCISTTANLSSGTCLCVWTSWKGTGEQKRLQLTTTIICLASRQARETEGVQYPSPSSKSGSSLAQFSQTQPCPAAYLEISVNPCGARLHLNKDGRVQPPQVIRETTGCYSALESNYGFSHEEPKPHVSVWTLHKRKV